MKKTLFILPLFVFQAWLLSSCSQAETYAEQKDKEYKAINSFLGRDIVVRDRDGNVVCNVGKIKTISEETFLAQDSTTDLSQKRLASFAASSNSTSWATAYNSATTPTTGTQAPTS